MTAPSIVTIPGGLHQLFTQLNDGCATAGYDCSVVTCINGVLWASHGKVGPKTQHEMPFWVRMFREWTGNLHQGLFMHEAFAIYEHHALAAMFHKAGVEPIRATNWTQGISMYRVKSMLQAGQFVHLPVDYGVLRRTGEVPINSETFSDDHSVGMVGMQKRGYRWWTNLGDPLADGRRPGISSGWQGVRFHGLIAATGAFGHTPAGRGMSLPITLRRGA